MRGIVRRLCLNTTVSLVSLSGSFLQAKNTLQEQRSEKRINNEPRAALKRKPLRKFLESVCLFASRRFASSKNSCTNSRGTSSPVEQNTHFTPELQQPGGASSDLRSAPHRLFASDRRGPTTAPCARTKHCVPGAQVKRRRLSAVVSCLRTFVSGLLRVVACTSQRVLLALSRSAHTRLRIVWLRSRACCVSWCSLLELQTSISA